MIWKTDWTAIDNYAINGADDFLRLINNYISLKNELNDIFGYAIVLNNVATYSYKTIPFAEVLNSIEQNLSELKVFDIAWISKEVVWQPYGNAPDYTDINRWETNGQTLENTINISKDFFIKSGTFKIGNNKLLQRLSRGRL